MFTVESLGSRLLTLSISCLTIWFGAGAVSVVLSGASQSEERSTKEREREAYSRGGLAAAAKVTGQYIHDATTGGTGAGPADLAELADLSDTILVGTPMDGLCRLTSDGRSVFTVFDVNVETVLKGPARVDGVAVAVPGGKVSFADGSTAVVRTPGFFRPNIGHRLVWFLQRTHRLSFDQVGDAEVWVPAQGPLGLYDLELPFGKGMAPSGNFESVLAKRIYARKLDAEAFLREVRQAVSKSR